MGFECPIPSGDGDRITLGHGGGGRLTSRLIHEYLLPALDNGHLRQLHDGAVLDFDSGSPLAMTTDSFVVTPPFFPGGDIGSLAVYGTLNDLAMCGARPLWLSLSLILEEGFALGKLRMILESIRNACRAAGVEVVTGDTKVVEKGKGDGVFINTTGIGRVLPGVRVSPDRVQVGDHILVNGPLAEHGICILSSREGLSFENPVSSDSANLWPLAEAVLRRVGEQVHVLRDATRGGLASVLHELISGRPVGVRLREAAVPVREQVRGACELFGLDPLYVANEGKLVAFVSPGASQMALEEMRGHPLGREAAIVGEVVGSHNGMVVLETIIGGRRIVDMISGEQLPRIC